MPWLEKFSCSNCEYESSSSVLWGKFNYFFYNINEYDDWIKVDVNRDFGWCYNCSYICPVETISIDSLKTEIEKQKKYYNNAVNEQLKLEKRFIKSASTKSRIDQVIKNKYYYENDIKNKEYLLNIYKNRKSKPKCLFCSSEKIEFLKIPHVDGTNISDMKAINFKHPDCGGELSISGTGATMNNPEFNQRIYDGDGILRADDLSNEDGLISDLGIKRLK